jgi:predicted metal-binding protein
VRIATRDLLDRLVRYACEQGAGSAAIVSTTDIVVDEKLAAFCRAPACDAYGRAASCPPHVGGPTEFRKRLQVFDWAIFLKIDVPTEILLSEERLHIYKLLHEIVAGVQKAAVEQGCPEARAFAGGSCKKIFCRSQPDCRVVDRGGLCRHPDYARPSMSGYGINVGELMNTAGWHMDRITRKTDPDAVPMGSVSGLVLVC